LVSIHGLAECWVQATLFSAVISEFNTINRAGVVTAFGNVGVEPRIHLALTIHSTGNRMT
jgi:hypothetical protein